MRGPEHSDVWICRNLQCGDAGGENDLCGKEERIRSNGRRRQKEKDAQRHNGETDHHGPLVTDSLDELAGGQRKDEVAAKERQLHQHSLGVAQIEDLHQVGDQRVIQAGEKAPHEEEGGDNGKRSTVVRAAAL